MAKIKLKDGLPHTRCVTEWIVPFGMYFNAKIRKAEVGDLIVFDKWENNSYKLLHKRIVKVNSAEFTRIKKILFGHITTEELFKRWEAEALLNGFGRNAIHKEEVLYLELFNLNNNE